MDTSQCDMDAGQQIPSRFPEDYYPVIGMSVHSCIEHYNNTLAAGEWEVAEIATQVTAVKERWYAQLTAQGIKAFDGAKALIVEAKMLGVAIAVGSSGVARP